MLELVDSRDGSAVLLLPETCLEGATKFNVVLLLCPLVGG